MKQPCLKAIFIQFIIFIDPWISNNYKASTNKQYATCS